MTRVEVPVEMPEGMMSQFEVDGQAAGYSGSPHGYITQSWVGRRNTSSVQVTNSPANVTALSITVPKVTDSTNARVTVDGTSGQENNYVVNGVADMGPGMLNSILSLIEVHQKQLKSLRADITVTSLDPKSNSTETRDGKAIYLSGIGSGNWTRVDWKNPDENLSIYANIFTFYQPKLKQVFIGKSNDETAKAVQKMLNLAKENIKSDYKLALIGSEELMPGVQTRHLELKQKSADLNPIEIWVENNGMILQAKFPGQNGKIITLLLTNVEKNVMLTKNDFKIEYPKDTLEVRGPVY